ncbi:UDP-glucose 4-epimerase GalE [Sphingobacterium siyangense]|jgi:UDP-glucose 4-epimerase|uniref:UDP-glucose 4-epimerase GalE n=1 Tax=Sphingobacterium siyangense TaxID=459529 RepID=UPI003C73A3D7
MKNKEILITGGLGYIGSHTVVELIKEGYKTVIIDNLSNSNVDVLDRIHLITGIRPTFYHVDMDNFDELNHVLSAHPEVSGAIHFAASKAVGESVVEPLKYYHNNLFSLLNLLRCYDNKKIDIVFSSSCTVYGQPDVLPVTESSPVKAATSPYGNTKQIAEEILNDIAKVSKSLKVISLRYFNPVGAHESALIGELPLGVPQNLVPFITQTAIGKREKLTVYGGDYNTPDGSCIRDYIHVVDLAKAHLSALKYLENGMDNVHYEVFNVGTGNGYSVLEVINAFEKVSGVKLNYEVGPRRAGDTEQVFGDTSKSEKALRWSAQLGIEDMMKSAWDWEKGLCFNEQQSTK